MEKQIKVFSSIVILSIFNIFSAKIAERLIAFKNNSIDEVDYSAFVSAFSRCVNFMYIVICIVILVIFYEGKKDNDKLK